MMRYLSICSGIEAATAAWHALGWQAAGFAEIERFPSAVLSARWPGVPNFGDFTAIEASDVGSIDLLVGGTPCQSFSIAGLREGLRDGRGNLALEYFALARRTCPRWLVWENVPGVLSSNGGRDFGSILGAMVECGYGFAYRVLDAQYFGVPQRRRRVFLVGYLGDWRPAAAVLFERQSLRWDFTPGKEARQDVAGTIAGGARKGGGYSHDDIPLAHTLNAKGGAGRIDAESETFITHALTGEGFDASEDGTGRGTPLVPVAYRVTGNDGAYDTGDKVCALGTQTDPSGHVVAIPLLEIGKGSSSRGEGPNGSGFGSDGDPMFTLQAGAQHGIGIRSGVRRLTPRECERLQGFPDDYTRVPITRFNRHGNPTRTKPAEDGPRYRAIGNSMAVPVMRWLGERIDLVETVLADLAKPECFRLSKTQALSKRRRAA